MKSGIFKQRTWDNESSSRRGKFYETVLWSDSTLSCNCPGWTKRVSADGSRDCKHTRDAARELRQDNERRKRERDPAYARPRTTVTSRSASGVSVDDILRARKESVKQTEPPEGRRRIFWED